MRITSLLLVALPRVKKLFESPQGNLHARRSLQLAPWARDFSNSAQWPGPGRTCCHSAHLTHRADQADLLRISSAGNMVQRWLGTIRDVVQCDDHLFGLRIPHILLQMHQEAHDQTGPLFLKLSLDRVLSVMGTVGWTARSLAVAFREAAIAVGSAGNKQPPTQGS